MKAEGHSRWAGLHLLGAAGAIAAALLAVASLASAAADSGDGATAEWVEIVLDLEKLPAADRERSEDRLQAIDDAIASEIPLFRSFDPREVLAESLGQLAALGAELDEEDGAVLNFDTLGVTIPAAAREKIAALPWVDQVRYPVAVTPSGQIDSEGLALIGSDLINGAGITGAGIKVAIIDDSFNRLTEAMTDPGNELKSIPNSAQYRVNAAGNGYTNPVNLNGTAHQKLEGEHGTACAEVVYEVAPGVQFILIGFTAQGAGTQYSGHFTATQVEWAIRRAADLGAKVILVPVYIFHTMSNPTNSFTDDINYATGLGATVVVPAGNEELRHVEERFTPCSDCTNNPTTGQCANAANNTSYHAWDPTNEFLPLNDILPQGEVETAEEFETLTCYSATSAANPSLYEIRLLRFYDPGDSCDSFPGCPDDCGMTTLTGTARDLGQGFTVKKLPLYDAQGNDYNYYIGVRRKVSSTVNLCQSGKCIQNNTTSCTNNSQCAAVPWPMIRVACTTGVEEFYWATENGKSLSDLAVVNNAIAVGEVDTFLQLPPWASYGPSGNPSGPVKPDFVAPGGVSNFTVFDYNISDNLDFTGSSAAAAHVAGLVALIQGQRLASGQSLLTPSQVRTVLRNSAIDMIFDSLGNPSLVGPDSMYGYGFPYLAGYFGLTDPVEIYAAVLPTSRSVQVGTTASAYATVLNVSSTTATGCVLTPLTGTPATGSFWFQTTDPNTNQLVGTPNTPANIPAGGFQRFAFFMTPNQAFNATEMKVKFKCTNTDPAPIATGVNTIDISGSSTAAPDIIAFGATLSGDGYVRIPGNNGSTLFGVAISNIGAAGTVTLTADTNGVSLPLSLNVCVTNSQTGACSGPISASASTFVGAGANATFAVLVGGGGFIPLDALNHRIFARFKDSGGVVRGSTSVAVLTQ